MARAIKACSVDGCNGLTGVKGSARGLCAKHYVRFMKHGDVAISLVDRESKHTSCTVGGCDRPHHARGYCTKHLRRVVSNGSPLALHPRHKRRQRWIDELMKMQSDDCITWPFGRNETGRGLASIDGKVTSAPRVVCIRAHGEPPTEKHQAAHTCGKGHQGCVNPRHLRWATAPENEADKVAHGTLRRGRAINTAVLSETDVREIRAFGRAKKGTELAALFGVTPSAISAIRSRKTWAWLD